MANSIASSARESRALTAYLHDIQKHPRLTRAETLALCRRIRSGDESARHQLVQANLRLVVSIARSYAARYSHDLLDLIQEGSIGLFDAADRFDPDRGFVFSTYAAPWVRKRMQLMIGKRVDHLIQLPPNIGWQIQGLQRVSADLHQEHGRPPSSRELEDATGFSAAHISALLNVEQNVQSLNAPLRRGEGEKDLTLLETLASEDAAEEHVTRIRAREVREALTVLPRREREILEKRFGFTREAQTLAAAGSDLGVSRQRIHEIEHRALRRLRALLSRRGPQPSTTALPSASF